MSIWIFRSRLRTHVVLAATSLLILFVTVLVGNFNPTTVVDRISLVSAYVFLLLISVVLLIGPLRAMRTGRVTINHTVRRDLAIWSAFLGLVHLLAGTVQSMTPVYVSEFVTRAVNLPSVATRESFFLWSTIVGVRDRGAAHRIAGTIEQLVHDLDRQTMVEATA